MKSHLKNYLSITKRQWNGLVVFLLLIAIVLAAPYVYRYYNPPLAISFKDFEKDIALLKQPYEEEEFKASSPGKKTDTLFAFNPNNLPDGQWHKLGLSDRQIIAIKNYEAQGGHFYHKEDLKKLYAITAGDYKRLQPYINIFGETATISNKLKPGETIELNAADSAQLTRIHGVGPAFANRIVEYRKRLGGFLQKEQLKEVYGIDDEKYRGIAAQVTVNPARITPIKINEVDFELLRRFPYLSYKQSNAIIQYRLQHGNYSSITDMQNIAILDDIILRKIEPYINFK